jgi:GT2 family glycosyltransferase
MCSLRPGVLGLSGILGLQPAPDDGVGDFLDFRPPGLAVVSLGRDAHLVVQAHPPRVELVQLGHPHTYTEACNIGARIARARGCKYLCVSNNDIVFRTDVMGELLEEMERDPRLGIVAPSQIIIDETLDRKVLAYRVSWNLERVDFLHDIQGVRGTEARLESDFCELTCALVRMSAIDEIGFLDDEYGFYHEDADFGFRLRKAGYGCAYMPKSQIDHCLCSTFNREGLTRKATYIVRNKVYFAKKHLGYGMNHELDNTTSDGEQAALDRDIHSTTSSATDCSTGAHRNSSCPIRGRIRRLSLHDLRGSPTA